MQRTGAWLGLLTLADGAAVVGLRPSVRLVAELTAPHAWLARVGADGAGTELAAAALWLAACWLAVGLVAAGVAAVPGAGGRAARRLAAVVLPRAVYRLVAGATGLGIVLTPLAAGAARPAAAATASPAWPTSDPVAVPDWPTSLPQRAAAHPHPHPSPPTARPASASHVVVAPGDSLWSIAADHLQRPSPQRVAATWPRWYAANRAVIGTDPNHIVAGEVLLAPTHHTEEGTA